MSSGGYRAGVLHLESPNRRLLTKQERSSAWPKWIGEKHDGVILETLVRESAQVSAPLAVWLCLDPVPSLHCWRHSLFAPLI